MPPLAGAASDDGANRIAMYAALRHIAVVDGRGRYTAGLGSPLPMPASPDTILGVGRVLLAAIVSAALAAGPAFAHHPQGTNPVTGPTGTDPQAPQASPEGPCTDAARESMPEGAGHDHLNIEQHRLACRMRQVAFHSLREQLAARPNVVLGEMDIKNDLAAIAVTFPESGFLLFDVADPSDPKFLSWYRGSECEALIFEVNCGAFVDISPQGDAVYLAVQSLSLLPGGRPAEGIRPFSAPGVEVIEISNPRRPSLVQIYPVVSEGGVHTARSHVIPPGPGPREPGEYVFSVQNGVGVDVALVDRSSGTPQLISINTLLPDDVHDNFIQNDPITNRTYLYVAAAFFSGFQVFDVTDPFDTEYLGEWDLTPECSGDWYAHTIDVTQRGDRRYVTMDAEIVDASPLLPDPLPNPEPPGCGAVRGNPNRAGPLWIVDASNFTALGQPEDTEEQVKAKSEQALVATWVNPAARAGGNLIFSPHNQQIVGDRIYLSHYHGGVYVLDASAAFAGRRERPTELGFIVPSAGETRPIYEPENPPLQRFFSDALGWRPSIWDMFVHRDKILAPDMVGGLYTLEYVEGAAVPQLSLRARYRRSRSRGRRCARGPVTLTLSGADSTGVRRMDVRLGRRRLASDRRAPFRVRIPARRLRSGRINVLRVKVTLIDGRTREFTRRLRAC